MKRPLISVVMAVRNGETYLRQTLESVFAQSIRDFEFIAVDDASTDGTAGILGTYEKSDPRLRVMRNEASIGPYPSANRALSEARAAVIARIDADDICRRDRLERQLSFLDTHPDHLLVGSGYRSVDGEGRPRYLKLNPLDDFAMRWTACFRIPIVHPSFCFRSTYPDGEPVRYRETSPVAQDYALVGDIIARGKAASIGDALVDYRMHPGNISSTRRREQNTSALETALRIMVSEWSPEEALRFEPLLATLYGSRKPDPRGFAAATAAIRSSISQERHPRRRRWIRGRAAAILAEAFLKGQPTMNKGAWAVRYALEAPDMVPGLAARLLEARGWRKQDPSPGSEV